MPKTTKPGSTARDRLKDKWVTIRLDEATASYLNGLAKKWGGTRAPMGNADTVRDALRTAWEAEGKPL